MKKYTTVFAIFVMVTEMACGQKEPKLLWEKEFGKVSESYLQTGFAPALLRVSPLGNAIALAGQEWNIFDKNGSSLAKSSDFGILNSLSLTDSLINWVGNKDSITFYNGDYQLVGKIIEKYKQEEFYQIYKVDDGILILKNGMIIKYDFKIKELWRYIDASIVPTTPVLNQKSIYQFFTNENNNYLILSHEGKKILQFKSLNQIELLQIQDKSFWISSFNYVDTGKNNFAINGFNVSKYDSTGKLLVSFSEKEISTNSETIYNRPIFLPDGSLIINYYIQSPNKLSFIKIDKNGNRKQVDKIISRNFLSKRNTFNLKMINDNEFRFVVGNFLLNDDDFTVFGVGNFENNQAGWVKDANHNDVEICKEGFLSHYNYSDELKFYNIDEKDKWNYKFKPVSGNVYGNSIILFNDFIYVNQADTIKNNSGSVLSQHNSLIKIRLLDGEETWKTPDFNKLFSDELGNQYVSNQASRIDFIPKSSRKASKFFTYPEKSAGYYAGFKGVGINFKNKTLMTVTLEKIEDRNYKSILRKYSTQDSYDSSVRCSEKLLLQIKTDSKPEDCPSVKVMLSDSKRAFINYQWQKDGKDLPNKTNDAYNFNESGNYTVVAKDSICQNSVVSNAVKITINPSPSAEIKASKNVICRGDKVSITAISNSKIYQWQKDQKDIPDATKAVYEATQAGTYSVMVKDDNCPKAGYSNMINLIIKPTPESIISTDTKGVVYEPFTVKMSANTGADLSYQWLKDDIIIPNENANIYEAKKTGKYNVSISKDGCTKLSDALTISILIPLANQEEVGEEEVKVYPNPSKGEFKIILPKALKSADIQLFDSFGRERFLVYVGEQAQADGLGQGVYFLRVQKGEKVVTSKLIIE